jgi:iron complex outermembrane receptor protein
VFAISVPLSNLPLKKSIISAVLVVQTIGSAFAQDAVRPAASPPPSGTAETERVVVVGGAIEQSETDKAQSVTILNENTLKEKSAPTLGDTLANEPGIAGSSFTGGSSRPVIRGQADNRVRVLNNGTEVFDVSNLSPDHAPSVSALLSESIEVVRGPATILYGSGAIGGVVNVADDLIPVEQPSTALNGEVGARFNSADEERSGAIHLTLSPIKHVVLHGQYSYTQTGDRSIPGFALNDRMRALLTPVQAAGRGFAENPEGTVPNTFVETEDYAFGTSYVWDKGYIGASFSEFLSKYGVPNNPETTDPAMPPARVHLDVDKRQLNARSSIVDPLPWFTTVNAKFVYTDYHHEEIDGNEVAARFETSGVDSRLELVHKPVGPFAGSLGGQFFYKELSVIGDEAFLQPTQTTQIAGFVFEELKFGKVRLQLGARIEHQSIRIDNADPTLTSLSSPDQQERDFLPVSGAAGILYDFAEGWQLAVNGTLSERAPTAEELFARGPHEATFQFIIGNPNLDVEKNAGVDLSLRKTSGVVTGTLSTFYNRYDGFIAFTPTGEIEDRLPVFVYTAKGAEFYGGEVKADFHLLPLTVAASNNPEAKDASSVKNIVTGEANPEPQKNRNDLFFRLQADYVHATDLDTGEPLPRITPLRHSASLNYQSEKWSASVEGQRVEAQDRIAPFETATPGYTFLNATVGYKFRVGPTYNYVYLKGTNLTDEEARDHLSFLKEVLPLAGRGVTIGVRSSF